MPFWNTSPFHFTHGEQIDLSNEFEGYSLQHFNQEVLGGGYKIMAAVSQPAKGNDSIQIYYAIISFLL